MDSSYESDKEILNMLQQNKDYNDPVFFQQLLDKKNPILKNFKTPLESWRNFYLKMVLYISKLYEDLGIVYSSTDKYNPEQRYLTLNSPKTGIKNIDPNNIIQIFQNLDVKDILNTCSTDKKFAEICDKKSFEIWSMLLKRDYYVIANDYPRVKENPKAFYMKILNNKLERVDEAIIMESKFKLTIESIRKYNPLGADFLSRYRYDSFPAVILVPPQKSIEKFSKDNNLTIDEFLNFNGFRWIIPKHFLRYNKKEDAIKPFKDITEMSYGKFDFYSDKPKIIKFDNKDNGTTVRIGDISANVIREIPTDTGIKVFEIDKNLSDNFTPFKKVYINSIPIFIRIIEGYNDGYSIDVFTTTDRFNAEISGTVERRYRDEDIIYKIQTSSWGSLAPKYIRVAALLYETAADVLDDIKNNDGKIPQKYMY